MHTRHTLSISAPLSLSTFFFSHACDIKKFAAHFNFCIIQFNSVHHTVIAVILFGRIVGV